jgi:hypothetical protein
VQRQPTQCRANRILQTAAQPLLKRATSQLCAERSQGGVSFEDDQEELMYKRKEDPPRDRQHNALRSPLHRV